MSDSYARTLTLRLFVGAAFDRVHAGIHERPHLQLCGLRSAGTHLLSTVTYATSPATHQTYLYENASYPYRADRNHRRERQPLCHMGL